MVCSNGGLGLDSFSDAGRGSGEKDAALPRCPEKVTQLEVLAEPLSSSSSGWLFIYILKIFMFMLIMLYFLFHKWFIVLDLLVIVTEFRHLICEKTEVP